MTDRGASGRLRAAARAQLGPAFRAHTGGWAAGGHLDFTGLGVVLVQVKGTIAPWRACKGGPGHFPRKPHCRGGEGDQEGTVTAVEEKQAVTALSWVVRL